MRESSHVKLVVFAAVLSVATGWRVAAQQPQAPTAAFGVGSENAGSSAASLLAFEGSWDYNALESINIATGRPEQTPRSATQGGRGTGGTAQRSGGGARGPGAGLGPGGGGQPGGFGGAGSGRDLGVGPTPAMMREQRDMSRDLLEVPEQYRISVSDDAITFIDDIQRARTYPFDGSKQKYQLGASQFNARVEWTGSQLKKQIEGTFGFRMTETYFLSPDGHRMFVIVRVGEQGRNRRPTGYDRVYDRIEPQGSLEAVPVSP